MTAIEVLEHLIDPVSTMRRIHRLPKPGGFFFFYTTGDSRPFQDRIEEWTYLMPEVHISFFQLRTMTLALETAGFEPVQPAYSRGYANLVKYKVLKRMRQKRLGSLCHLLPWPLLTRYGNWLYRLTEMPLGRQPA